MAARILEFEQYIVARADLLDSVIARWSPLADDEDAFWNAILADSGARRGPRARAGPKRRSSGPRCLA